jgi:molecular chaperone GrpE
MDETRRTPADRRGGGSEAPPAASGGESSSGRDDAEEPPAVNRWEDEGGIVEGPAPGVSPADTADYKDRWLRAEAELQNFRRRATREWEEGRRRAEEGVLLEMVGALDDLDRALEAAAGAPQAWTQGVALVTQRLREFLARQGVTVEDPIGQPFDPAFHEALLEVDAPEGVTPGTVVQVALKGYRRGGRALRPARVVVGRTPAGSAE